MAPLALFSLILFTWYATYAVVRHNRFLTAAFDLGIFDQAARQYSQFQVPVVPIRGEGLVVLSDHFHPIVATLAPLYWVWDDPRTLLVAQAALVAAAVPVVHGFARRRLAHWSAGAFTAVFAVGWPLQQLIHFDFHELAFAVPLLALAMDALDRKADRSLVVWCVALLLVREDMGLLVAMLGLLRARTRPRSVGLGVVVGGAMAVVVITQLVMARLSPVGSWLYWSYDALGEDPRSAITWILGHPWQTVQMLFEPRMKSLTWLCLFVPLLFLPLLSPYVVVAAPLLAAQFLTSRELLWQPTFHYWAPLWVILVLAAVDGAARIRSRRSVVVPTVPLVAGAISVMGIALLPSLYPVLRLTDTDVDQGHHLEHQRMLVSAVPENTCVEADNYIAPHLTSTNKVGMPGGLTDPPADFLALDMSAPTVAFEQATPEEARRAAEAEGYTAVWQQGSLVLLRAPDYAGPRADCSP
ncbi:DUF2079 domain-containing protein [Nocardioides baculatus]|uniref:DUF2079 domain-containing protein n=1 Tax=Nocardioides baculatus TaxID=2801337 RepID=A0ABS1L715_9ACTN|nr:DUF2079 domain-containing protein [Nocardioides baculatus]MBL0747480.1 DUF2079 domain-containing protein [Nocardioides baculatus]